MAFAPCEVRKTSNRLAGGKAMKPIQIAAATAADASRIYLAQRQFSTLPPETFPPGVWQGKPISPDGKVWREDLDPERNNPPIYCPAAGYLSPDPKGVRQDLDRVTIAAFYAARAAREGKQ